MNLIAIDPGKTTGWAVFVESGLVAAGVLRREKIFNGAEGLPKIWDRRIVLVENPRWYPHDHTDVNDLLDLAVLVGEIEHYYEIQGCTVELVWPRTWKGNVPKDIHNKRVLVALRRAELELLPLRPRAKDYDHNMLDAVGLGLWKLGRLR